MSMVLAFFSDMLFFILLLWLACAASVFIHEMGHAMGYMLAAKSTGWQITIGSGKNIVRSKRWVVNLLPFGGLFLPAEENQLDTKGKQIAMLAGDLWQRFVAGPSCGIADEFHNIRAAQYR